MPQHRIRLTCRCDADLTLEPLDVLVLHQLGADVFTMTWYCPSCRGTHIRTVGKTVARVLVEAGCSYEWLQAPCAPQPISETEIEAFADAIASWDGNLEGLT